jgi:hypothetical protein
MAVRDLLSAAQTLLFDKYWMCFSDPGKMPFHSSIGRLETRHALSNSQLELMAREFALLGRIPARRTPDNMAFSYVRLLHELLHRAERAESKDASTIEGVTQYLAIHAYLGEVPEFWISHPRADFSKETAIVADRIDSAREFSVLKLARAYFVNGDFNTLFSSSTGDHQK